jgi:thiamine biosynthesis lipoprotein
MATTAHRQLGFDMLANAGGDLRSVARREPWTVEVDSGVPGRPARAMDLVDAGVATSGVGKRRWDGPDGPKHHIVDPRTRQSAATYWTSASVLAADAASANAAATASIVQGEQAGPWLQSRRLDAWLNAADHQALVGTWGRSQEVQPC